MSRINKLNRIALCHAAAVTGGSYEWKDPWIWLSPENTISRLARDYAASQLEKAGVITVTSTGRTTQIALQPAIGTDELLSLSREERCIAAEVALLREQDPAFGTSVIHPIGLRDHLFKIFPELSAKAADGVLNDLEYDLFQESI